MNSSDNYNEELDGIATVVLSVFPELDHCMLNFDCQITEQLTSEILKRFEEKINENGLDLQNEDVEEFLGNS